MRGVGIPTVSLWASVPHYVHNAPSPKAVLALLAKLEELTGLSIPRGSLETEAKAWEAGVDALAAAATAPRADAPTVARVPATSPGGRATAPDVSGCRSGIRHGAPLRGIRHRAPLRGIRHALIAPVASSAKIVPPRRMR